MIRVTRFIPIALFAAACASAQVTDSDRIEDLSNFHDPSGDAVLCWDTNGRWNFDLATCACPDGEVFASGQGCQLDEPVSDPDPVCGDGVINQTSEECDDPDLAGETCESLLGSGWTGTLACFPAGDANECTFDTSQCSESTGTGLLADATWLEIPDSSMETLYDETIDGNITRFQNIQTAWSGATCAQGRLYIWGGGHGDSSHNGVFSVGPTGDWMRETMPTPEEDLAGGGQYLDGTPASKHTYYAMAADDEAIYAIYGAIWPDGTAGDPPGSWRFDLAAKTWSPLPDVPYANQPRTAVTAEANGLIYASANRSNGQPIYDPATNEWTTRSSSGGTYFARSMVYADGSDRFFFLGDGHAKYVNELDWGTMSYFDYLDVPNPPAIISENYLGATYYAPENKALMWHGGPIVATLDADTLAWEELVLQGDPGSMATVGGAFGRFSYCGGKVMLVNGTSNNLFVLDIP